jgi:hypothetical protein
MRTRAHSGAQYGRSPSAAARVGSLVEYCANARTIAHGYTQHTRARAEPEPAHWCGAGACAPTDRRAHRSGTRPRLNTERRSPRVVVREYSHELVTARHRRYDMSELDVFVVEQI